MPVMEIPLKHNKVLLIDSEDYPKVAHLRVSAAKRECGLWYAVTADMKLVHRIILDAPRHLCVDHINDDGLDNRRCNLRLCTNQENIRKARHPVGVSGFRGVRHTPKSKKPWRAIIHPEQKKTLHLGYFATKEEAARAYDTAAKQFFGPFARLNFPHDQSTVPPEAFFKPQESSECETEWSAPRITGSE